MHAAWNKLFYSSFETKKFVFNLQANKKKKIKDSTDLFLCWLNDTKEMKVVKGQLFWYLIFGRTIQWNLPSGPLLMKAKLLTLIFYVCVAFKLSLMNEGSRTPKTFYPPPLRHLFFIMIVWYDLSTREII